jgi:two-component system, NarL family, response regulator NreC
MEKQTKTKVVIADDNQLFRDGIKAIFAAHQSLEIVGEAQDGFEALRMVRQKKPDLLLLDLSMPKLSGISVIYDIRREFKELKILALSIHNDGAIVDEALAAGVDGYCVKDASLEELQLAIATLIKGQVFISPKISQNILDGYLQNRLSSEEPV